MIDLSLRIDAFSDDERMVRDAASSYCSRDTDLRRVRALRGMTPSQPMRARSFQACGSWCGHWVPIRPGSRTAWWCPSR